MTALATIHVALKQLGIDQDDARDLYERQTGKRSLREMSPREHEAVIGELRRIGFTRPSSGSRTRLEGRFAKKLQALWIAAWNLGIVENRDDRALVAFVKRQTGLDHVRFLHYPDDARKAIEALKGWLARDGGVQWGRSGGYDFLKHDQGKVAWAQFRIIMPGATLIGNRVHFRRAVAAIVAPDEPGMSLDHLEPRDWQKVMNAFGERIRKARRK